ncbi:hypothetical protein B2G71_15165 [Novosphingobium sp. PC22D]|uniref:HdeD family acid-resistance protein n=1 Tax=Novosphingobium sp. PC22D TaxID=1962403 RepID=UPI000BEF5E9F|nr:DUF308 domain-containing protein [Novosphingobium sp. PC22D]PEQ11786.1 hypothetical protein B2G71_15165 [Novosphingobium sp. PC22D]
MERENLDPAVNPRVEDDPVVQSLRQLGGRTWGWILAYGILLLVFAVIVAANPLVAGIATGIVLGVVLFLYGIAAIAAGATSLAHRARWLEIVLGVIAVIAGLYAFFNPVAGALSLVLAIGIWLLVTGVLHVVWGFQAKHDRGWRLFLGVLDVVLGLILLFGTPATGIAFLAVIVMVSMAVRGVFLIMLALSLKKAGTD